MSDAPAGPGPHTYSADEVQQQLEGLSLPLDPASIDLRVVTCFCHHGRGESVAEDPDDFGIPGCCNGYGVRLEVTPGLEPLVLHLAAIAAHNWTYHDKQDVDAFGEGLIYEVERQVAPSLEEVATARARGQGLRHLGGQCGAGARPCRCGRVGQQVCACERP